MASSGRFLLSMACLLVLPQLALSQSPDDYPEVFCNQRVVGSTADSTNNGSAAGADVVFRWRHPENMTRISFDTCNSETTFDTEIWLYSNSSLSSESLIFSNDDIVLCRSAIISTTHPSQILAVNSSLMIGRNSSMSTGFAATNNTMVPGKDVWIVVDGHDNTDKGTFGLNIWCQDFVAGNTRSFPSGERVEYSEVPHPNIAALFETGLFSALEILSDVPSLEECTERCLRERLCLSFIWSPYDVETCAMFIDHIDFNASTLLLPIPIQSGNMFRPPIVEPEPVPFYRDPVSLVAMGIFAACIIVAVISFAVERHKKLKGGRHASLIFIGLAIADFVSDVGFVVNLLIDRGTGSLVAILALAFIVAPVVANLILVAWIVVREFSSTVTRTWFEKHSVSVTAFLVVSMTHIDVVTILNARVFGAFDKGSLFNAPFSDATLKQLSWFGLVGNFLEDIPQLGIQMAVLFGESGQQVNQVIYIAIATSFLALVFGLFKRILFVCVLRCKKKDDKENDSESGLDVTSIEFDEFGHGKRSSRQRLSDFAPEPEYVSENICNDDEEEPFRDYYSHGTCAAHPFQWPNPTGDGSGDPELEDFDIALEIEKLDVSKPGWPPKKGMSTQFEQSVALLDEHSTLEGEIKANNLERLLTSPNGESIKQIAFEKVLCAEHMALKCPLTQEQMFALVLFCSTDCYKHVQPANTKRWQRFTLTLSYAVLKLSHAQRYFSETKQVTPSDCVYTFVRTHKHSPSIHDLASGEVSHMWSMSFLVATTQREDAVLRRTNKDATLLLKIDLSNGMSDYLVKRSCNVRWLAASSDSDDDHDHDQDHKNDDHDHKHDDHDRDHDDILICANTPLAISSCAPDEEDKYADFHTAVCTCNTEQVMSIVRQQSLRPQQLRRRLSISKSQQRRRLSISKSQRSKSKSRRRSVPSDKPDALGRKKSLSYSKSISQRRLSRSASAIVPSLNITID